MKVLLIGDIVGKPGRKILSTLLPNILSNYKIDFCIANCENAAGGFGLTTKIAEQLFNMGIDILTSGNHIWDKKESINLIAQKDSKILRPANYPDEAPGQGSMIIESPFGDKIGVINISGRVFVDELDCPFKAIKKEINKLKKYVKVIIVDLHAEATSEKVSIGWYIDGEVSAVLGTHTHVQTADERILPEGTAYITDVGMTGPRDSVIGVKKEIAINKFITKMPKKFEIADGVQQFNGVIVDINEKTGKAKNITRLQLSSE